MRTSGLSVFAVSVATLGFAHFFAMEEVAALLTSRR
jgi:hypothetical protein